MEHSFTAKIREVLEKRFGKVGKEIFEKSHLVQYINEKTRSAGKGSKSRSSFSNLYAIYVVIEDYIEKQYHLKGDYSLYEGAVFSKLFTRQRELPFGSKLQNHSLNNRMNSEFKKYYPKVGLEPIIRDQSTNRYWINQNLLLISVGDTSYDLAETIIEIIDEYVRTKQDAFSRFVRTCQDLQTLQDTSPEAVVGFIKSLLEPNVDARLFEIVSYSILKHFYKDQHIYWGFEIEKLNKEALTLYKTGRTNANDGGIDFVMKPLGRFFQVTETLDFKKYFLDIDKIQRYPITFVIKSIEDASILMKKIESNAHKNYPIKAIVTKYMECIEEIINIPILHSYFDDLVMSGNYIAVLDEIITQSKVEFNYEEEDDEEEVE